MKVISEKINIDQFHAEVNFIISFLEENDVAIVKVAWGYSCDLNVDEMWDYEDIRVEHLKKFINNGIDSGIYSPNESDFFIEDLDSLFEFKMCHESDVHFKSEDKNLHFKVKSHWADKGIKFYDSVL